MINNKYTRYVMNLLDTISNVFQRKRNFNSHVRRARCSSLLIFLHIIYLYTII